MTFGVRRDRAVGANCDASGATTSLSRFLRPFRADLWVLPTQGSLRFTLGYDFVRRFALKDRQECRSLPNRPRPRRTVSRDFRK